MPFISRSPVALEVIEGRRLLSTYYVDASDTAPGGAYTSLQALQSTVPVFSPGDQILLRSGGVFTGGLRLDAHDAGGYAQRLQPVFIGTFDVRNSAVVADDPAAPAPRVGRATITVPATSDLSTTNHA